MGHWFRDQFLAGRGLDKWWDIVGFRELNNFYFIVFTIILGDRINATIYAVLSQSRTFEFEAAADAQVKLNTEQALNNVEGCYDSYHTLQAENLWRDMRSVDELNALVLSWMLTLEKQVKMASYIRFGEERMWFYNYKLGNKYRDVIIC